ncbi:MAG: hypothetical protein WAM89_13630 [Terriglobales bacterium]
MTLTRQIALRISHAVLRSAAPESRDWAQAALRELDFIEDDWTALLWALGGMRILFRVKSRCKPREVPLTRLGDIPLAERILADKVRARTLSLVVTIGESIAFTWLLFFFPNPLQRLGSLLTVAAMLYMTWQLLARRVREFSSDTDLSRRATDYRAELERQRDFHRGWWFWSRLALMLPGLLLFCAGGAVAEPKSLPIYAIIAACFIGVSAIAVPANLRLARKYQSQIDELNAIQRQPQ